MSDDFPRLFEAPNEWSFAAQHIAVFKMDEFHVAVEPDDDLRRELDFLAKRHIELEVSVTSVPTDNACGQKIEGMALNINQPLNVIRKLKRLGASLAYVGLDGPLYYGHIDQDRTACKYPLPELASRLARTLRVVWELYPNVKIVDHDGPQAPPGYAALAEQWLDAYRDATGRPLDGWAMEVNWRSDWRERIAATTPVLRRHHIKTGLFLDANGGPTVTDESWMAQARQNGRDLKAAKFDLDFVMIITWMQHPRRMVPETDPLAFTSLVDWYVRYPGSDPAGAAPAR
ncbi:MAG TPA: hypothetical protein VN802_21640 [Stellaceae bacterium]|nr:hypothetical protein [Stellaceae bacterium]